MNIIQNGDVLIARIIEIVKNAAIAIHFKPLLEYSCYYIVF